MLRLIFRSFYYKEDICSIYNSQPISPFLRSWSSATRWPIMCGISFSLLLSCTLVKYSHSIFSHYFSILFFYFLKLYLLYELLQYFHHKILWIAIVFLTWFFFLVFLCYSLLYFFFLKLSLSILFFLILN